MLVTTLPTIPFKLPSGGARALADITTSATVHKSRKLRFELHLKIHDLNNVPLVSGGSVVKWTLPHSLHGDNRGRTSKRPVINHRVDYHFGKIIPVRMTVDRNNRLSDCPIEFEVTQEFDGHGTARDEKVVLGKVTLNLAEYVAESEAILRDTRPATANSHHASLHHSTHSTHSTQANAHSPPSSSWHARQRSSLSTNTKATGESAAASASGAPSVASSGASISASMESAVEEGVTRRYLMQDSKINGTLKVSVLMVQVEGERNFVAPALKSAPMFGGIAGLMASGEMGCKEEEEVTNVLGGRSSTAGLSKSHDAAEVQDVYRRALAASWACQSTELPADECIEDIFGGGDGFRDFRDGEDGLAKSQHAAWPEVHEDEAHEVSPAPSRTSSGSWKHGLLPRLRRKGDKDKAQAVHQGHHVHGHHLHTHGRRRRDADGASVHTASSDELAKSIPEDVEDDGGEHAHATLRPRDILKFRSSHQHQPASPLAALRAPHREDSGLSERSERSDRTIHHVDARPHTPLLAMPSLRSGSGGFRSASGGGLSLNPNRLAATRHNSTQSAQSVKSVKSAQSVRSGNSGNSASSDEQRRLRVTESDMRDNFVAWQLPRDVSA